MPDLVDKIARGLFELWLSNPFNEYTCKLLFGTTDVTWEMLTDPTQVVPIIAEEYREQAQVAIRIMEANK